MPESIPVTNFTPRSHMSRSISKRRSGSRSAARARAPLRVPEVVETHQRERRIDEEPLLGYRIGDVRVVVVPCFRVLRQPGAVDQVVHAGLDAVAYPGGGVTVRRDLESQPLGVNDRVP